MNKTKTISRAKHCAVVIKTQTTGNKKNTTCNYYFFLMHTKYDNFMVQKIRRLHDLLESVIPDCWQKVQ